MPSPSAGDPVAPTSPAVPAATEMAVAVAAAASAPPPIPPMPETTTLKDLITPSAPPDAQGISHLGALSLNANQLAAFQKAQTRIAGDPPNPSPDQLKTLWSVEHGQIPEMEPVAAAPKGTTVEQLVTPPDGQKPDAKGYVHLGHLAVKSADLPQFAAAQRDLASKDPEAVNMLYKLENGGRDYTLNLNNVANNTFDPKNNTISWDPHKDGRDQFNKANVPPVILGAHEEGHALGTPMISRTLQGIPDEKYSNLEEKRVIEGIEARAMAAYKLPPRHSHIGVAYPVATIDSISPRLHVTQDGHEKTVGGGFQQTGKVVSADAAHVKLDVGHGKTMELRTNELTGFMGNTKNVVSTLQDASAHRDNVTFSVTNDAKVTYQNPEQLNRWFHDRPSTYQLIGTPAAIERPPEHQLQQSGAGR